MMTYDARRAELDARIEDYLDGLLSPRETRAMERRLIEPDVSAALAEAIAFRELMATAPPLDAPEGLAERIIDELGVGEAEPAWWRQLWTRKTPELSPLRVLDEEDEPELAPAPAPETKKGRGTAALGAVFGTLRLALAPVMWLRDSQRAPQRSKPAWWRRALSLGDPERLRRSARWLKPLARLAPARTSPPQRRLRLEGAR